MPGWISRSSTDRRGGRVMHLLLHPLAKPLALVLLCAPGATLLWGAAAGQLGANPAEALIRSLGDWALRLLCLTLAVTPLRLWTGWHALARFRRMLGVASFFYAVLHFLAYAWLDMGLYLDDILRDIGKRPFILVGFAALLGLLPLAATSFNRAIRALGAARWQRLHRLVLRDRASGAAALLLDAGGQERLRRGVCLRDDRRGAADGPTGPCPPGWAGRHTPGLTHRSRPQAGRPYTPATSQPPALPPHVGPPRPCRRTPHRLRGRPSPRDGHPLHCAGRRAVQARRPAHGRHGGAGLPAPLRHRLELRRGVLRAEPALLLARVAAYGGGLHRQDLRRRRAAVGVHRTAAMGHRVPGPHAGLCRGDGRAADGRGIPDAVPPPGEPGRGGHPGPLPPGQPGMAGREGADGHRLRDRGRRFCDR